MSTQNKDKLQAKLSRRRSRNRKPALLLLQQDSQSNITRLDNAIDNFADRIADAENALQNLEQQKRAAEVEVAKPFAQEEELAEKSARLAELNALLNIDRDRSSSQDAPEESEETEAPATRPSVLAALEEKQSARAC